MVPSCPWGGGGRGAARRLRDVRGGEWRGQAARAPQRQGGGGDHGGVRAHPPGPAPHQAQTGQVQVRGPVLGPPGPQEDPVPTRQSSTSGYRVWRTHHPKLHDPQCKEEPQLLLDGEVS